MIALLGLLAAPAVAVALPAPVEVATLDVAQDRGAQRVHVQTRVFPAGAQSGWHVHAGTEIAWIVEGEMEIVTAGGVRRLRPGDSFVMRAGEPHNGVSLGPDPARVAITLVVDRDAPLRTPVAPPKP